MYRCTVCFFFKQKTAYEMRISDWSSDVCSSDLGARVSPATRRGRPLQRRPRQHRRGGGGGGGPGIVLLRIDQHHVSQVRATLDQGTQAEKALAGGDEDTDVAVGQDVVHLRRSQDRIDRHENGAGQRGAEEGGNRLHALVEPDAEALATHDLQRRQPGSVRFSRVPQRAVGEAPLLPTKDTK